MNYWWPANQTLRRQILIGSVKVLKAIGECHQVVMKAYKMQGRRSALTCVHANTHYPFAVLSFSLQVLYDVENLVTPITNLQKNCSGYHWNDRETERHVEVSSRSPFRSFSSLSSLSECKLRADDAFTLFHDMLKTILTVVNGEDFHVLTVMSVDVQSWIVVLCDK